MRYLLNSWQKSNSHRFRGAYKHALVCHSSEAMIDPKMMTCDRLSRASTREHETMSLQRGHKAARRADLRRTLKGSARRFAPAGVFNGMKRRCPSRCRLYRASGTDLREHCQHVEIVRGALDLATLDLDDLTGRQLDRLVRWRNGTC